MLTIDVSVLSMPDVAEWQEQLRISALAALPAIGEALVEHCDRCFELGVDPWGAPWQPLADSTLEKLARKAAGPTRVRSTRNGQTRTRTRQWTRARSERALGAVAGKKILIDRGFLRRSLHWYIEAGDNGTAIVRVSVGGPAAAYARVHQWGFEATPARPYLPLVGDPENPTVQLPPALEDEIFGLLQAQVDRTIERLNAAT